jgi:radical SAM superfamily enzyme YgiQ (UPF0313 family)
MKQLDAVLIFPPPMDRIDRVYSAPHFLCSFLESNGFNTKIVDLNLAALLYLARTFEPEAWSKIAGRFTSELDPVHDLMAMEIAGIRYTHVFGDTYKKMFGHLYQHRSHSCEGILKLADSSEMRCLMDFLHTEIIREIVGSRAPLVGFSIPFSQQLAPAVALARQIKKMADPVHICFGGPVITLMSHEELAVMNAKLPVDSFVKYEGEQTLARLLKSIKGSRHPGGSGKVLTFEQHREQTGGIHDTGNQNPAQVFEYNRFGPKALAQMPRAAKIPIRQSAGCYWKKCTFCDYVNLHRDKTYRPRKTADILSDIQYYADLGFSNFRMLAEAVPPASAMKIAQAILKHGLEINWHAFVRVDTGFTPDIFKTLKKSGFTCTVGMESASSRILALLNKGYDLAALQVFINHMKRADFSNNHLNIMVGVPGETWEDALETLGFCMGCNDVFNWFKPSRFTLTATSDMGQHPEKYGIRIRKSTEKLGPEKIGGRLSPMEFEDPDGMSETDISALVNAYAQLNLSRSQHPVSTGYYNAPPGLPAATVEPAEMIR